MTRKTSTGRRSLRASAAVLVLSTVIGTPVVSWAQATDPVAARELFKRGYDLRSQGKCAEAIPLLEESVRLDPQTKTLLNLADCEDKLSRFGAAQKHFLLVRERARKESNAALEQEAQNRLTVIEQKLPRLTLRLPASAPPDATVFRDGIQLGKVSLGLALPAEVGVHRIVVRAEGFEDGTLEIAIKEGDTKDVTLSLGARKVVPIPPTPSPIPTPAVVPEPKPAAPIAPSPTLQTEPPSSSFMTPPASTESSSASGNTKTWGWVMGGIGVAGMGVGGIFGLVAKGKYSDSLANGCNRNGNPNVCNAQGASTRNDARSMGSVATGVFIVGAACTGVGLLLLALPAKGAGPSANLAVAPTPGGGHLSFSGGW